MKCGWCERPLGEDELGPTNQGTEAWAIDDPVHRGPRQICSRCLSNKPDWLYRCDACGQLMDERVCPQCSTKTTLAWKSD